MSCDNNSDLTDNGGKPYLSNIEQTAMRNRNFRTSIWTGSNLQMTLMCIPPCGDIGQEIHENTDQFIRVEHGTALVVLGKCKDKIDIRQRLSRGDAVFIPAGTWHNIINAGNNVLRVSSIYAPPNHPKGTIHHTKEEAEREEH